MTNCISCGEKLKSVFEDQDALYQFDNALWIGFYGGYGMFIESKEMNGIESSTNVLKSSDAEAVLCHDCAHDLCKKIPWIEKLINTHGSHSHTSEYIEGHPDHYGWDYDRDMKN